MIKHTQIKKVYKYDYHTIRMKRERGFGFCMISNFQSKGFYNDTSLIKLGGIVTI
jgi:hypothetical protein